MNLKPACVPEHRCDIRQKSACAGDWVGLRVVDVMWRWFEDG